MNGMIETWFCVLVAALLTGHAFAQNEQFSDDISDDSMAGGKRGWSMMRLARGLHMLRLGKRSTNSELLRLGHQVPLLRMTRSSAEADDSRLLSANEVQDMLDSLFDEARDQTRRQPPLPRYGRDSSSSSRSFHRNLLDSLPTDDASSFSLDIVPVGNGHYVFRPAPRGGRYKRSLSSTRYSFGDFFVPGELVDRRAVALPRIGRVPQDSVWQLDKKAVPRPRIGKRGDGQMSDSKDSQSQNIDQPLE